MFLEHETTRPQVECLLLFRQILTRSHFKKRKRGDGSESTGTLGVSGVKQIISALEHWRLNNQHEYPDVPAAQIGLRHDLRIKTFETAAVHKEPQRVKMAHTLKAKGTNAGMGFNSSGFILLNIGRYVHIRRSHEMFCLVLD